MTEKRPAALSIPPREPLNDTLLSSTPSPRVQPPSFPWSPSTVPSQPPLSRTRRPESPPMNHFSTLPPSPPRSSPPSPPPSSYLTSRDAPWLASVATSHSLYTPPASASAGSRFGTSAAFQIAMNAGVQMLRNDGSETDSENSSVTSSRDETPSLGNSPHGGSTLATATSINLLAVQDESESYRLKKRPSVILTSVPSHQIQGAGLALGLDANLGGGPSPRLRRQYPTDSSMPPSPTMGHFSPLGSPVMSSPSQFLSPTLPLASPTIPMSSPTLSSTAMAREPSSPRLLGITEPLGRLAQGLVRRASSSTLGAGEQLPTSISRSSSPSRSPQLNASPTLSSGSLSPSLAATPSAPTRRTSFAAQAQAREKEKEKENELRQRAQKMKKSHNRMFSWAQRPAEEVDVDAEPGSGKGIKTILMFAVVVGALLGVLYLYEHRSLAPPAPPPAPRRRVRQLQRRHPTNGASFIHPDVIDRRKPQSKSYLGVPLRWLRSVISSPKNTRPVTSRNSPSSSVDAPSSSSSATAEAKGQNVFVPAPAVPYATHHPLPPPPVHSDAPQRDTLVLYRILGNDLPPRHSPGQTLRNLRFLLQHESDFSTLPHLGPHPVHHSHAYGSGSRAKNAHSDGGGLRVDKYFVLNRISEPELIGAIIGLLKMYSVPDSRILVIPFDWKEYERHDFRWDGGVDQLGDWGVGPLDLSSRFHRLSDQIVSVPNADDGPDGIVLPPPGGVTWEERKKKSETLHRLRALDYTYHEKNLYAMNNNGGRNFALKHGRSLPTARWILPLDGNSFFTPAAMYSIVKTLSISGEGDTASRYLIIPMARLLANDAVLSNNSIAHVPPHHDHEGSTPMKEAEHHHRPEAAPDTPEEPQIGFRYDSTEEYEEAMRYGRRSKLELLWRLGAIGYSRGLDRRTLPWEASDREHITAETWSSIPGALGTNSSSPVHRAHNVDDGHAHTQSTPEYAASLTPDTPERGPVAFSVAGWVYRLFSGDLRQEQYSPEAVSLRNRNRIKGIAAFLERLDDRVARGKAECGDTTGKCGFSAQRMWSFDSFDVDRLRQKYKHGIQEAVDRVSAFEEEVYGVHASVSRLFFSQSELVVADVHTAATNASLLAMAAYVTGNHSYSNLACDLITARFMRQVPVYYQMKEQLQQSQTKLGAAASTVTEFDGAGYGFPPPLTNELADGLPWGTTADDHVAGAQLPSLPFDPLEFDPTLLLDAIRMLQAVNAPQNDFSHPASQSTLKRLFVSHLSYLLFSPTAIEYSRSPPSAEDGAHFDAKVAALAAFVDDARLFVRVANRARLRLDAAHRELGLLHDSRDVRDIHWRLIQGVSRTKLLPFSLASDPLSEAGYGDLAWGLDNPFHLLEL